VFYGVWFLAPSFNLLKLFTATLVSWTTGSELIVSMDGVFLRSNSFLLRIITDCTAWKELSVFLALFFAWPKKKDYKKAVYSMIAILLYNLLRLDVLMLFHGGFDYFHPAFQYLSIAIILFLWTWSVGITKVKFGVKVGKRKVKKRKKKK
jgi:exosortase/archaeosortase